MSQKKEYTQPKTAKELEEAGLFKMSAEINLQLYREFQAECKRQGLIVKHQVQQAIQAQLKLLQGEK
jgi:hypothetical protein